VTQAAHISLSDARSGGAELKYRKPVPGFLGWQYGGNAVEQAAFSKTTCVISSLGFINDRIAELTLPSTVSSGASIKEQRCHYSMYSIRRQRAQRRDVFGSYPTASNLANAESVNGDVTKIYRRAIRCFRPSMDTSAASFDEQDAGVGVRVLGVVESTAPPLLRYHPRIQRPTRMAMSMPRTSIRSRR